jgi:hypothetical protein
MRSAKVPEERPDTRQLPRDAPLGEALLQKISKEETNGDVIDRRKVDCLPGIVTGKKIRKLAEIILVGSNCAGGVIPFPLEKAEECVNLFLHQCRCMVEQYYPAAS